MCSNERRIMRGVRTGIIDCNNIIIVTGTEKTSNMSDELRYKIDKELRNGLFDTIIYSRFYCKKDSMYNKYIDKRIVKKDEKIEIHQEFNNSDAYVIEHSTYSVFNDETKKLLNTLLNLSGNKKEDIKVFICGANVGSVMLKTCLDLFDSGIRVIVLKELCENEDSLKTIEKLIGEENMINGTEEIM